MAVVKQPILTALQATQDSNVRGGKHARSASHPGDMQQALLGMDTDDYPRSASHAYASSRAGGFSPTSDFVGRAPSTRVSICYCCCILGCFSFLTCRLLSQ